MTRATPMPLIDIVMTVKNGGRFLPLALDSLAAQTLQDFRLLVCDDGSTDETGETLRRETRFPMVIISHDQSRGIAPSINELLSLPSQSRYIARFDADDVCHPERLARQMAFLETHPDVGVVGSRMEIIDENGAIIGRHNFPTDPAGIHIELLFTDPIGNPSVMVRAELMRTATPAYKCEFTIAEDYDLWCRLSLATRMANLPEPLVRYRRHGQASGITRRTVQLAEMRAIRCQHAARIGLTPASRDLLLAALGLSDSPAAPTWQTSRQLLRELDAIFQTDCSRHARDRRDEIALTLVRSLGLSDRLRLILADRRTAVAYVRKKTALTTAMWRTRWTNFRAASARNRLARRVSDETPSA